MGERQIVIPHTKLRALHNNPVKSAIAVSLVYVNDSMPGISRVRKGRSFTYRAGKKKPSPADLQRIKKLVIPPAWDNVWICSAENGHLQVTGHDVKKRKQYKYHPLWNNLRNHTKFHRLGDFGKTIPAIRARLDSDLVLPGLPLAKVLAAVVSLIESTNIRIGNAVYEKLYGSYGLTTLKDQHVRINGSRLQFMFKGKKGVPHNISLTSKRLAKIVKQCRDIPGKELFQYIDPHGNYQVIDSGMVNNYINEISDNNFTAKDFRTWAGTVHALAALKASPPCHSAAALKRNIVSALDQVADKLGNTRAVCKKYYVHPIILSLYENNDLSRFLKRIPKRIEAGYKHEEKVLLHILGQQNSGFRMYGH